MTACWLSMPSFYYVYQQACYRKTLKICSRANEQLIVPSFQQRNLVHKDHQTQTEKKRLFVLNRTYCVYLLTPWP